MSGRARLAGEGWILACTVLAMLIAARMAGADTTAPYAEFRASFATELLRKGPAPQEYTNEAPPQGVHTVAYPSGSHVLKAWLALPRRIAVKPVPGIVYLHGGFALGKQDLYDAVEFYKAGFAVMTPMLRGENGNPGDFEFMMGEVDDAVAATQWLATQPFIDPQHIYVFGHSIGGGIAALIALHGDANVRHSASSGGLYGPDAFERWKDLAPFDTDNANERRARLLRGNERWMLRPHHAYIGSDDDMLRSLPPTLTSSTARESMLRLEVIDGNHASSLAGAIERYIRLIESENSK